MKNIIIALLTCMCLSFSAQAQIPERLTKVAPDTSINQDTVILTFNAIPSNIQALEATVTKVSGTVGGHAILQGTINGSKWYPIDTMVNTDQATNIKVWPLSSTTYYSYRIFYLTPSGTQRSVLSFAYLRRPDEH